MNEPQMNTHRNTPHQGHGQGIGRLLHRGAMVMASLAWLAWAAAAQAGTGGEPAVQTVNGVEIRRTSDGIPHVRAASWRELGMGIGYVQAQDALCTLADAFTTYEGRRSWFFGPDAQPARNSTFGQPRNLDLDFFFRTFADEALLVQYRAQQPPELNELIEGYAAGYNRHLARDRWDAAHPACAKAAWVREISAHDVYRRLYAAQLAAGYAHLIPQIANAQPAPSKAAAAGDAEDLRARLSYRIGQQAGLGSNALAFGRQATGEEGAVLLGNPHWYWGGPDRFYQMHLTIPGRLNVAGVGFLGVPLVMIGFNEHVAWSHTVSAARRFGLFDLTLDEADPTRLRVDGKPEAMETRSVSVDVRDSYGSPRRVTRTFYRTRFGPMIDLGSHNPAFGWGRTHALAIRDVNAENFRVFRNFFYWNQAKSLDDFIAIQRREAAMAWVNTVAIGRGDGRVWYGDVGAVPHVPDVLRKECATALSHGFATVDPLVPFLDGSKSACDWRNDANAMQPGALPASALPGLLREDYVANMNNSYWLANALQPLEGFPSVLGGERQPLSLRGRLGHRMAQELSQGSTRSAEDLEHRLRAAVLTPRAHSAELFKSDLLAQACASSSVTLQDRQVDVARACEVLRQWSSKADANERGVLLWEAFWARVEGIPGPELYGVAFSAEAPLDTPRAPGTGGGRIGQALAAVVVEMAEKGVALDAPLGSQRFVRTGGQRVPLYGGCHSAGYFAVACNPNGGGALGPGSHANSYLQVVRFGPRGVVAHTLLAHGLDESAVDNGSGSAPVMRYARKDWLRFPFTEAEIASDPRLERRVLLP